MAKGKEYDEYNAITYLSVSILTMFGNTSTKLSKVLSTFKWLAGFSVLVGLCSLVTAILAFVVSLPDRSADIHVGVLFWACVVNAILCAVFIFVWVVLCTSRSAYNLLSSFNRSVLVITLFGFVRFILSGLSKLWWFWSFYDVDYVTKAQLLVDLQMAISWSDTLALIYLFGFVMTVVAFASLCVSACPEVAGIKHSRTSVKELFNMQ